MKLHGDIAFVSGGKGVAAIDISDAKKMVKISSTKSGVGTWAGGAVITVKNNTAFVAGGHGFAVLDVSEPHTMEKIAMVKTGRDTQTARTTTRKTAQNSKKTAKKQQKNSN